MLRRFKSVWYLIGDNKMKFVISAILVLGILGALIAFVKLIFAAIVLALAVLCMGMFLSILTNKSQV